MSLPIAEILAPPNVDYVRILPELVLSVFGMLIMVLDPLIDEYKAAKTLGAVALAGAAASLAAVYVQAQAPGEAFSHMVRVDNFSIFFHAVILIIVLLSILSSFEYMEEQGIRAAEYYGLILMGAAGMCLMTSAVELVLIFIALEISSISTYILAGFLRRDPDAAGLAFWLNKLNQFHGNFVQAEMVKAFLVSGEYRQRFGQ